MASSFIFNVESKKAVWDDATSKWKVDLVYNEYVILNVWAESELKPVYSGRTEVLEVNSIVSASGSLSNAKHPDIKGYESFKGPIFHTQQWDHNAKIAGSRVAVVGNGSTGELTFHANAARMLTSSTQAFKSRLFWLAKLKS